MVCGQARKEKFENEIPSEACTFYQPITSNGNRTVPTVRGAIADLITNII